MDKNLIWIAVLITLFVGFISGAIQVNVNLKSSVETPAIEQDSGNNESAQ